MLIGSIHGRSKNSKRIGAQKSRLFNAREEMMQVNEWIDNSLRLPRCLLHSPNLIIVVCPETRSNGEGQTAILLIFRLRIQEASHWTDCPGEGSVCYHACTAAAATFVAMQGLKRLTEKHIEVVCRPKDQSVVKDAIKKAESESGVNIPGRKVEVSSRDKLPDDRYTIRWLPLSLHDISRFEILIPNIAVLVASKSLPWKAALLWTIP